MSLGSWLRRAFHRPPTLKDCLDAVHAVRRMVPPERYEGMEADYRKMIAAAPCEPLRAPSKFAGEGEAATTVREHIVQSPSPVVSGPGLVERTRQSRERHLDRYRDDEGWGDWEGQGLIWSEFSISHDAPGDAA